MKTMFIQKFIISCFLIFIVTSCGSKNEAIDEYKDLISIDITSKDSLTVVKESNKLRFFAQGTMKDGTTKVLDVEKLDWHSSDTSVAYISNDGLLTSIRQGVTIIKASYSDIESNEVNMRVVSENGLQSISINIAGASNKFFVGDVYQVKAIGHYGTGETQDLTESVIWNVNDENIATISNSFGSHGRLTIKSAGNVEISAQVNGLESNHIPIIAETVSVTEVKLLVDKETAYINERIDISAVAKFSNGEEKSIINEAEWKYETVLIPSKTGDNQLFCEEAGVYRFYILYNGIKSNTIELNISQRVGVLEDIELIVTPNQDIYQNETVLTIQVFANYDDHFEDITSIVDALYLSPNIEDSYVFNSTGLMFTKAGDFELYAEYTPEGGSLFQSNKVNIHVNELTNGVVPSIDDLVINELLVAPPGSSEADLIGDANNDGVRHSTDDEFIEMVNVTNKILDLSNVYLTDLNDNVIAEFPDGTLVRPYQAIVIFGGGNPVGDFGGATVFTLNGGSLSLNNTGDIIFININDGDDDLTNDQTIFSGLYDEWSSSYGSATLSPELQRDGEDWEYKHHYEISGNTSYFSPGTRIDGSAFFE